MRCTQCKYKLNETDLYCPRCGTKVIRTCAHCAAVIELGDLFCRKCGTPISAPEEPSAITADTAESELPKEPPAMDEAPFEATALPDIPAAVANPAMPAPAQTASNTEPAIVPFPVREPARPVSPAARASMPYRPRPRPAMPARPLEVYVYKGIFPRFLAAVLDGFILGLPVFVVSWILLVTLDRSAAAGSSVLAWAAALLVLSIGVIIVILDGGGGTPGKRIVGLRIIDAQGNKPGFGRALVRNLLRLVDFLPFGYLVGIILVAASEKKQRLGDRAAGTFIVGKE